MNRSSRFRAFADAVGPRELADLARSVPSLETDALVRILTSEVDLVDDAIVWVTRVLGATDWAVLDDFLTDTDAAGGPSTAIAERLEARGGIPVHVPAGDG